MREQDLRRLIVRLGYAGQVRKSDKDWLLLPCLLAKWNHAKKVDKHPSFSISIQSNKQSYCQCFACGFKGDLGALVSEIAKHKQDPSLEQLATEVGLADSFVSLGQSYEDVAVKYARKDLPVLNKPVYYRIYPPVAEYQAGRAYCAKRGIKKAAAELINLRYDDDQRRVLFPIEDKAGNLYGFSGRAVDANNKLKIRDYLGLPKSSLFLGLALVDESKPVVLVEGLFAYAHLVALGVRDFCNPLATLGATASISREKLDWLLSIGQRVVILLDGDAPGQEGAEIMREQIAKFLPCDIATYPEGVLDPDHLTLEQVKHIVESASPFSIKM